MEARGCGPATSRSSWPSPCPVLLAATPPGQPCQLLIPALHAESLRGSQLCLWNQSLCHFFLKIVFTFTCGEGKQVRGRENQCVVAFHVPPAGDLARNPGMRPDWESNQWPFCSQASTLSTEPHQPGLDATLLSSCFDDLVLTFSFQGLGCSLQLEGRMLAGRDDFTCVTSLPYCA